MEVKPIVASNACGDDIGGNGTSNDDNGSEELWWCRLGRVIGKEREWGSIWFG